MTCVSNTLMNSWLKVKVSSADEALGIKAVDYIALAPKLDVNQAYQLAEPIG